MYLPSDTMYNKDFLRQVLAEDKELLELRDVKFRNIPVYDELAVKKFWPMMKNDAAFMKYFPDKLPSGRLPDRDYFWNIFNTLYEQYVSELVRNAIEQRNTAQAQQEAEQVMQVTEGWWEKLNAVPFISCKSCCLINLL